MYRSMHALLHSNRYEATIQDTRRAISRFRALAEALEDRFESIYDCGITDARTTYALCWAADGAPGGTPDRACGSERVI